MSRSIGKEVLNIFRVQVCCVLCHFASLGHNYSRRKQIPLQCYPHFSPPVLSKKAQGTYANLDSYGDRIPRKK